MLLIIINSIFKYFIERLGFIGVILACMVSWDNDHSIKSVILNSCLGWLYVTYHLGFIKTFWFLILVMVVSFVIVVFQWAFKIFGKEKVISFFKKTSF